MAVESMQHEGRLSALEAQYNHLATKADLERLGKELSKELGEKINQQTRWFAVMWMTSVGVLAGLILSRPV